MAKYEDRIQRFSIIIESIQSDEKKLEQLAKYEDRIGTFDKIIESIQDSKIKLEQIKKHVREKYVLEIVKNIDIEALKNNSDIAIEILKECKKGGFYYSESIVKYLLLDVLDSETRNKFLTPGEMQYGSEWQTRAQEEIMDENNVILASPTGSGKTRVFMDWMLQKKERPIFITSPIIALSNQRYKELLELGYKVGLQTGDMTIMPRDCDIICCTQEIYTNRYTHIEDATLIMDEFHYIFENMERARAYIDALHNSKAKNILICSGTLGDIPKVKKYVDGVSERRFYTVDNKQRLTGLSYEGKIEKENIRNALVVAFSNRNLDTILERLRFEREEQLDPVKNGKILQIAHECRLER